MGDVAAYQDMLVSKNIAGFQVCKSVVDTEYVLRIGDIVVVTEPYNIEYGR